MSKRGLVGHVHCEEVELLCWLCSLDSDEDERRQVTSEILALQKIRTFPRSP